LYDCVVLRAKKAEEVLWLFQILLNN
jgi:hypothetical protein